MTQAQNPIQAAIDELMSEIEVARLDLDAKIRSLSVLQGIMQKMNSGTDKKTSRSIDDLEVKPKNDAHEFVDLHALDENLNQKRRTLADDVRDLLPKIGPQEFSIAHIEFLLSKAGIEVAAKSPRSRISVALARLCEDGVLVRTFTGAGNAPNKYRVKSTMTDAEVMQALASNPSDQNGPESLI